MENLFFAYHGVGGHKSKYLAYVDYEWPHMTCLLTACVFHDLASLSVLIHQDHDFANLRYQKMNAIAIRSCFANK